MYLVIIVNISKYVPHLLGQFQINHKVLQVVKNYLILSVLEVIQTINTTLSKGK